MDFQGAPLAGVEVLLVDDNPDSLDVVCAVLERAGATVVCMLAAEDALACLMERRFDLVLSDLSMPDHDGFWLARQVVDRRAALPNPDVRLLAITAHVQAEVKSEALAAGFEAVVTKPLDPRGLVAVVQGFAIRR
jgi:CheY-like chemotaxis protein